MYYQLNIKKMATDKPIDPILEQSERLGEEEGVEQTRDSVKADLHVEKLARQKPKIEKIYAAEIREEVIFSRQDIAKLIILFAVENKLELDKLEVTEVVTTEEGALLVLEVRYNTADGGYQLFNYTIKGRHKGDGKGYKSGTTSIDRTFWNQDGMPENGGLIAEYKDGKWNFEA